MELESGFSKRIENLSAERKALLELLIRRKGLVSADVAAIARSKESRHYPLSFAQQRLWFLDQMEPGNAFYNEPLLAIRISGPLNVTALWMTVDEIVRRHESLRTTFINIEGQPFQVIAPHAPVQTNLIDLRGLPLRLREAELKRLAKDEANRPFDLAIGPLLRTSLIRMEDKEHVVFLEMHHIVTDGWSNRVLLRELAALYRAFAAGKPSPLKHLPIRYVDFAIWQRNWLKGEELEKLVSYWKKQLGPSRPTLELPIDYPRPSVQRFKGALETLIIPEHISSKVKDFIKPHDATIFMALFATFVTLLYRYTGQEDLIVGSPIANRSRSETEGVVGFFVNTLVLRVDLSGNPKFTDLLARVRKVAVEAYSHQDLPFEKLVEALQPERDLSRQAFFQTLFVLHNYPKGASDIQGLAQDLTLTRMEVEGDESKLDLAMAVTDLEGEGLKVQINYSTDLFNPITIKRMLGHYENLLRQCAAQPEARLNSLKLFTDQYAGQGAISKKMEEEAFTSRVRTARRRAIIIPPEGES